MKLEKLDYVLVPLGLLVLAVYHAWLLITIFRYPRLTVIGINAECRKQWVLCMMTDPLKNGVLMVQTIRNNIQASTLLETVALTLSSLISVFVSTTSNSGKYFSIVLCSLVAFLCYVQCTRYYAHVSFLATLPTWKGNKYAIEYVTETLKRASFFWSLGMRALYFTFPLFLWIFGPIPMFLCCFIMSFVLYFLDTTTSFARDLYSHSLKENENHNDPESAIQSLQNGWFEDSNLSQPLLTGSTTPNGTACASAFI